MATPLSVDQFDAIRRQTLAEYATLPPAIGRYEIRGELGRGGMGIVYDAFDPLLERSVAIKVIHGDRFENTTDRGELMRRFEREQRAAGRFFHANVAAVLDAGVSDEPEGVQAYYVMEKIDGESLDQKLRNQRQLSSSEGLRIAAAIARGLDAAHSRGLVHRDLKPSNVLITPEGDPKVADFGLVHLREETSHATEAGKILGSPHYLAPEQLRGGEVSEATDLFALGVMIVRMLSGKEPFRAERIEAHFQRVLFEEPEGLDKLPTEVQRLVERLLAKCPEDRPNSAAEVAVELQALAEREASARSFSLPTLSWRRRTVRRRGVQRIALLGPVLLGLLVGGFGFHLHNQLVALEVTAETQWKQVENQLQRQRELLPELVRVASRYSHQVRDAERVAAEAERLYSENGGLDPQAAQAVDDVLAQSLNLANAAPDLERDRRYRDLVHEISGTKNRIAIERARYNEAVGFLNQRLQQFPWRLVAGKLAERNFISTAENATAKLGALL